MFCLLVNRVASRVKTAKKLFLWYDIAVWNRSNTKQGVLYVGVKNTLKPIWSMWPKAVFG